MTPEHKQAARDILAFYVEVGVDALLEEEPVDHFAPAPEVPAAGEATARSIANGAADAPGRPPLQQASKPVSPVVSAGGTALFPADTALASPDAATMAAREAAKSAKTLDDLKAILNDFQGCALRTTATQLVFADGNPQARVMFVGEAPGRDEDIAGLPFVGRSGKLLDRMMAAIGLDRTSAYIANIIPWRPPGNRTPTPQESQICLPFILRQIELANPDILVCLGGPSAQTLLGFKDGIKKTRGRWLTFETGTREIRAIATLHPAYLLRSPLEKRLAWRDFLAIKKALES